MLKDMINKAHNGDCMVIMKDIPDNSVDLIVCDLPYGITNNKWDSIIPYVDLWREYKRVLKKGCPIVLFSNQPFTTALINSNLDNYKYTWYWVKSKPTGFLSAYKRPMKRLEEVNIFCEGSPLYNYQLLDRKGKKSKKGKSNVSHRDSNNWGAIKDGVERKIPDDKTLPMNVIYFDSVGRPIHPTQKPVDMCEFFINTYSNEGNLVLDNTAGSGTTAIAAKNTNRNFIVIEQNKEYFDIINQRLDDWKPKVIENELFDF